VVRVNGEIVIRRPVDEVFDFVADERNEPQYNPHMTRSDLATPEPIGLGSRFHAEITSKGRTTEMTVEFTEYQRPQRLGLVSTLSAMTITGGLTFEPVPEGTRMQWSWELAPRGLFRLASPLIARTGRRQEQAIWSNLKRLLEARAAG
jgi:uncharacterized membrane protein